MDAIAYVAAKQAGNAQIIKHGVSTLLVSYSQGEGKPRFEQGYQRGDFVAARELAQGQAEIVAAWDVVIADADAALRGGS